MLISVLLHRFHVVTAPAAAAAVVVVVAAAAAAAAAAAVAVAVVVFVVVNDHFNIEAFTTISITRATQRQKLEETFLANFQRKEERSDFVQVDEAAVQPCLKIVTFVIKEIFMR